MKTAICTRCQLDYERRGRDRRVADTSSPGPAFPLQLVYLVNNQQGQLIKRLVPVEQLLMYQQLSGPYALQQQK